MARCLIALSSFSPIVVCLALLSTTASVAFAVSLPIVDLGYVRQQATAINSTGQYYNFSNIRYAEPPTGSRRFALPVIPSGTNNSIDDGLVARICPQASPDWESIQESFIIDYLLGATSNFNFSASNATAFGVPIRSQPFGATEDCLFLDVMVPQSIFDHNTSAPVLVWIYGGGMTSGSKTAYGSSAGLIKASQATGTNGIIYVAMNYRLGALGWLAGASVAVSGVANAGLYDQRLALEWVRKNIHLFGGDPSQVTVMGESAGASSIMHQITAFGNNSVSPFQRAILQSPAFQPLDNPVTMESVAQDFLDILGVNSIDEARTKNSASVIMANSQQIQNSLYGSFTYGVAVDGLIVPELPGLLLYQGLFSKNVTLMIGHNQDEGLLFSDPQVNSSVDYTKILQLLNPSSSLSVLAYLEDVLYPAVFSDDAAYGYDSQFTRYVETVSESAVTCNTVYLESAVSNQTFSYAFDVYPGLHGQDLGYTFWNGGSKDSYTFPLNQSIARAFQEYLTSFALTGTPSAAGFPEFPIYSAAQNILSLQSSSFVPAKDDVNRTRCAFWQQGLFNGQEISVDGFGIDNGVASVVILPATSGAATYMAIIPGVTNPSSPVAVQPSNVTVTGSLSTSTGTSSASTTSQHGGTSTTDLAASSSMASTSITPSATSRTGSGVAVHISMFNIVSSLFAGFIFTM